AALGAEARGFLGTIRESVGFMQRLVDDLLDVAQIEAGRRVNRRVEIVILDEKVDNLIRGEDDGAFETAFSKLKAELNARLTGRDKASR
ncbi:MAG: hypothetical protein J0L85_13945, partial [Zoogloea sp.]|nr:hypothetical protein [Zoogloea sp.]